jgi:hypothetical protein
LDCPGFSVLSRPGFVLRAEQARVSVRHCPTNGSLPYMLIHQNPAFRHDEEEKALACPVSQDRAV